MSQSTPGYITTAKVHGLQVLRMIPLDYSELLMSTLRDTTAEAMQL
jgi:hypothetical protein